MIIPARRRVVLPAVIALGSNLGDRAATLRAAVADIDAIDGVSVTAVSSIVESAAIKPDGPDAASPAYLNAVALVGSALPPDELLAELNRIEAAHGRVRADRWGDRTLDLDIVDFAGMTMNTVPLTLPHPYAAERPFVLVPWLQVQPDAVLTGRGPIAELEASRSPAVRDFDAAPLFDKLVS